MSFLNVDARRIKSVLGLEMEEGFAYTQSHNYINIGLPAKVILGLDETPIESTATAGKFIHLVAAGTLNILPGLEIVEVVPNPALMHYGLVQPGQYYHSPNSKDTVTITPRATIQLRRNLNLLDLQGIPVVYIYLHK